eukprot:350015-Chlamydomonas_euryale.AAC.7
MRAVAASRAASAAARAARAARERMRRPQRPTQRRGACLEARCDAEDPAGAAARVAAVVAVR